jgi:hypothetical protein
VKDGGTGGQLFLISTTNEAAEIWNSVLCFASTVASPSPRATSEVNTSYCTAGGIVDLGKNWAASAIADSAPSHTVPSTVTGWANLIKGSRLARGQQLRAPEWIGHRGRGPGRPRRGGGLPSSIPDEYRDILRPGPHDFWFKQGHRRRRENEQLNLLLRDHHLVVVLFSKQPSRSGWVSSCGLA